jgi:predicted MFS family arabinose efflux permease
MGFFVGGALGGWLLRTQGLPGLFAACAALMLLWLLVAWPMRAPSLHAPIHDAGNAVESGAAR